MKRSIPSFFLFGLLLILLFRQNTPPEASTPTGLQPNEWLFRQRAYPTGKIDQKTYRQALKYKSNKTGNHSSLSKSLNPWYAQGPFVVEGRITDIEITSTSPQTLYVGAASGGIFKSPDMGASWISIFDDNNALSIGDMALAPSNESIVYVGTGEANAGGGSLAYDGDGVYKSLDGGDSWIHLGLEDVGSIGKVIIDSNNPDVCYIGAMGHLFENNEERGVFRTKDGGESWEKVLFINDSTGVIDLAIHPTQPDIIYAATWERIRRVNRRSYGGTSSGIYRSMDGGDSWQRLTNGLPGSAGRIGIAISHSNPNILYAIYSDATTSHIDNIYKSTDGGSSWTPVSKEGIASVPYMWWFGKIYIDPSDPNLVYIAGFNNHKSTDGGNSWTTIFSGVHVDQHAICINPLNHDMILSGNDGGLFLSENQGASYQKINGLPITQFYTCEMDFNDPYRLLGGAQDNGTLMTNGAPDEWSRIFVGDGFRCLVDPSNSDIVYAEYQYGNLAKSTDGGSTFIPATNGISNSDRFNWNTAVVIDPTEPSILYYGTNRLYKSEDGAENWEPISPDLSSNPSQYNLLYGTITSISVSPIDNQIIWVGTDDGKVQVTDDGGNNWLLVSQELPNRWVTSVCADPFAASKAYVSFSGYRNGENIGHIFSTSNLGSDWIDITGDLPDIPVNEVLIAKEDLIHIATDIGVFFSMDEGQTWELEGVGLPNVIVTDLTYHAQSDKLLAATYGRGMYLLSLNTGVGFDTPEYNLTITAFPLPFTDNLNLSLTTPQKGEYHIQVYNASGKLVLARKVLSVEGENVISFPMDDYPSGVYFVEVMDGKYSIREWIKVLKL